MKQVIAKWLNRYFSEPEAIFLVVALLAILFTIAMVGSSLTPIVASIIIAYMLDGFVKRLEKYRFPHLLSVLFVYMIFLSAFVIILVWLLPLVSQQLYNLFTSSPNIIEHTQGLFGLLEKHYPEIFTPDQLKFLANGIGQSVGKLSQYILSFSLSSISNIITITIYLVLVPLLVFFFLKDKKLILSWLAKFLPTKKQTVKDIWQDIDSKIGDYIRGKIIEVLLVTFACFIFFFWMDINYVVLLSVCVGLSAIIPYVGAVIVTVPVFVIGCLEWGWSSQLLYLMIGYGIIQAVDANITVPLLFSEKMHLHPIAIILALLVFGSLWGFWGIFFAIPLATVVDALLKRWPRKFEEE